MSKYFCIFSVYYVIIILISQKVINAVPVPCSTSYLYTDAAPEESTDTVSIRPLIIENDSNSATIPPNINEHIENQSTTTTTISNSSSTSSTASLINRIENDINSTTVPTKVSENIENQSTTTTSISDSSSTSSTASPINRIENNSSSPMIVTSTTSAPTTISSKPSTSTISHPVLKWQLNLKSKQSTGTNKVKKSPTSPPKNNGGTLSSLVVMSNVMSDLSKHRYLAACDRVVQLLKSSSNLNLPSQFALKVVHYVIVFVRMVTEFGATTKTPNA